MSEKLITNQLKTVGFKKCYLKGRLGNVIEGNDINIAYIIQPFYTSSLCSSFCSVAAGER